MTWNGSPLLTTYVSSTELTAVVPNYLVSAPGAIAVGEVHTGGASNTILFKVSTPTPTISTLDPPSVPAGGPGFTLSVNGCCFASGAVIQWNGSALPTTFVNFGTLTAAVSAGLIANPGSVSIAVSAAGTITNAFKLPVVPVLSTGGRSVVNPASWLPVIAPGSLISIWGSSLSTGNGAASSVPLPASLNGTSVIVNGAAIPLLRVTPYQIDAQVPFEAQPGAAVLVVEVNGAPSAQAVFTLLPTAPGVLTSPLSNHALAQNYPDGSLNSPQNPTGAGGTVTLYLTGQGALDQPVPTGAAAPDTPFSMPLAPVQVTVGGQPAQVLFAGLAPGLVGILQINLTIPQVAGGAQTLGVTIGDVPADPTVLFIKGN